MADPINRESTEILPPLNIQRRQSILDFIGITLPEDYVRLVERTDGFKHQNFELCGLSGLDAVFLSKETYHILVRLESDDDNRLFICARKSNPSSLWLLDPVRENAILLKKSFKQVLEELVKGDFVMDKV